MVQELDEYATSGSAASDEWSPTSSPGSRASRPASQCWATCNAEERRLPAIASSPPGSAWAAELATAGEWGRMAAVRGNEIVDVALAEAMGDRRSVPPAWIEAGRVVA